MIALFSHSGRQYTQNNLKGTLSSSNHTVQNWTYNPKQIWHYFEAIRDSFMIRVNGNYGKNRYSMGYF